MTIAAPQGVPRLLAGWTVPTGQERIALADLSHPPIGWSEHLQRFGPLVTSGALGAADAIGGRGGANFPLGTKLRAVMAHRTTPVVVANGAESEPGSAKDTELLAHSPHLVLDGVELASSLLGTREAYVVVHDDAIAAGLRRAANERGTALDVSVAPRRYVAGQETALLAHLEGRAALPRFTLARTASRGLRGRPTLVANVETLAQWALAARFGPAWHQGLGLRGRDRSSRLVSVTMTDGERVLAEVAPGTTLGELREHTGAPGGLWLIGGLFGTLVNADHPSTPTLRLVDEARSDDEVRLGAGGILVAPHARCLVCATSELLEYLARQRARQCGPCDQGVPELAALVAEGGAPADLAQLAALVDGRGACALPSAAANLARVLLRHPGALTEHRQRGCQERPFQLEALRRVHA
jgi:NADH:ubiquinone oxidoreductase subunit F (NADH-binding)